MTKSHFETKSKVLTVSQRVDWLTITVNTPDRKAALLKRFLKLNEALKLMGELPSDWSFHGYKGLSTGRSAHWGSRKDTDILIVSGEDACAFWGIFAPLATNCSRVDLAVTVTLKYSADVIDECLDWVRHHSSKTLRKLVRVERQDGVGQTLYVMSRASDQFGRLYDKGVQENPKNPIVNKKWRYEVEYKGDASKGMLGKLIEANEDRAVSTSIIATVYNWFNDRDVPPVFSRNGGLGLVVDTQAVVTTSEQKLRWIAQSVRPTVAQLLAEGMQHEVLEALGLT